MPERDYDPAYRRESSSTGVFVSIIVALALLSIGYLVFSPHPGPRPAAVPTVAAPQ